MGRKVHIHNPYADQVKKLLVYINCDKLLKEKIVIKDSRKVSGIKTTHRGKILPKVKKQIRNITIHRIRILQSCLFMNLYLCIF